MTLLVFFSIILLIAIPVLAFITIRNEKVCDFRIEVVNLCAQYNRHLIYTTTNFDHSNKMQNAYEWFYKGGREPSYNRMMFSLKPLELKYWYSEENINRLLNKI